MIATLAVLVVLLLIALGVVVLLWRADRLEAADLAAIVDELADVVRAQAAELDNFSIAGPPLAACAALTPDDPSLLPAEVEQWLRTHTRES